MKSYIEALCQGKTEMKSYIEALYQGKTEMKSYIEALCQGKTEMTYRSTIPGLNENYIDPLC